MENKEKIKILDIVRYIIGGCCIICGIAGVISGDLLAGFFIGILGISFFPIVYKKFNISEGKKLHIVMPIIFFLLALIFICNSDNKNSDTINEINNIEDFVQIDNKKENDVPTAFVIEQNKKQIEIIKGKSDKVTIEIIPSTIQDEKIQLFSTDDHIAYIRKFETELTGDKKIINVYIDAKEEGEVKIYVKLKDTDTKSEEISIKVLKEEKLKDNTVTSTNTNKEQKTNVQQNNAKPSTSPSSSQPTSTKPSTNSSSSQSNSNNTNGRTVYRTPSGKRYHFDPDCGGKNSYKTTLKAATSAGLTPCKKCAQ